MCFVAQGKREFEKHSKGWEDFCSGRYPLPSDSMKKVTLTTPMWQYNTELDGLIDRALRKWISAKLNFSCL